MVLQPDGKAQNRTRLPRFAKWWSKSQEVEPMDRYEVIIYWSAADNAFIAEVPELKGCVAHGPTRKAALTSAEGAIAAWLANAKEFGDPVPQASGRRLMVA